MKSYFRIYRESLHCELMKDREILQVWIHLCDLARFKKTVIDGMEILPGQLLTSAGAIAQECDLNRNRVLYILRCLEKNGFIRWENIRNSCSLITVLEPTEKQVTQVKKPTFLPKNATVEPTKEIIEPEEHEQKDCCGLFSNVYLTKKEKRSLQERNVLADSYIEKLSAYKRRTNKMYDDDFAVLCEWISGDEISKSEKQQTTAEKPVNESRPKPSLSRYRDMNTDFFTAPASYDLEKAEALARSTVPVLRKRKP